MQLVRSILGLFLGAPAEGGSDVARLRREALAEAAATLAEMSGDAEIERVLRTIADAAAHMTGTPVAVVLVDASGSLERFTAKGMDACMRETLTHPEALGALVGRMRALGRPLGTDDLEGPVAGVLAAVAPHGLLVVPMRGFGLLVLIEGAEPVLDEDAVGVVVMLARLAVASIERVRHVSALLAGRDELRRLCADTLSRRDEELGRAARDLHEGVCQRLAAANAQLEALGAQLDGRSASLARLRDARALVNHALGELREMSQGLRPSVLESLGYVEALRWYLARLRERSGVALSLEVEGGEDRLPVRVERALYRATEEALAATVESRPPQRLSVRFHRDPVSVRLQIGGTAPETVDLVAIRERLRPLGGAVEVTSTPDDPQMIEVRVPAAV